MKRVYLIVFILFLGFNARAQKNKAQGYVGLGYTIAFFELDGLNEIIDEYNSSRNTLTKEFKPFNSTAGFQFGGGVIGNKAWFDYEVNLRRRKTTRVDKDPTVHWETQDLKLRNFNTSMSLGFSWERPGGYINIGLRGDMNSLKMVSRSYNPGETKGWYNRIGTHKVALNGGPAIEIFMGHGGGLSIAAHYLPSWYSVNWSGVNNILNPSTHQGRSGKYDTENHVIGFSITMYGMDL